MPPVRSGLIEETQATVSSCEYHHAKLRDVDFESYWVDNSYFVVTYSYRFKGRVYTDKFESSIEYEPGELFSLKIDPSHPSINSVSQPDHSPVQIAIRLILGTIAAMILLYAFQRLGLDHGGG